MEESRAINGAQRPLHRHQPAEPPPSPSLALVMGALFAGRPPMWGHSSRCFAFGGVSPCIISGQPGSDCIPIVFPTAGKTILGIVFRSFPKNDRDPSMRTDHSAINGAQRPLRQHKPPESPPSRSLALAGIEPMVAQFRDMRTLRSTGSAACNISGGRAASRL